MNRVIYFLVLILCGCASKNLSSDQAAKLIREEYDYPKPLSEDISRVDPLMAKKMLDEGLEKDGLVSIVKFQNGRDYGKPLVYFEQKAKPFLMTTPTKDTSYLQQVQVTEIDLGNITGIKVNGKMAKVEYTLSFGKQSPFYKLLDHVPDPTKKHYACFELYDTGWKLVKCLY